MGDLVGREGEESSTRGRGDEHFPINKGEERESVSFTRRIHYVSWADIRFRAPFLEKQHILQRGHGVLSVVEEARVCLSKKK